jgi:hypothetical protein
VAINLVAGHFVKAQPDYYIKFTSDNPLNPKNKAMPLEQELLKRFRANGELKELMETGDINNKPYLVSARPNKATPECLTCHGDAARCAPEITKPNTGSTSGYGYTPGRVEGVLLVGVPIGNIDETALQRSLGVIGIITALFTLFFLAANLLMKRSVITPLVQDHRDGPGGQQGAARHQDGDRAGRRDRRPGPLPSN